MQSSTIHRLPSIQLVLGPPKILLIESYSFLIKKEIPHGQFVVERV